MATTATVVLDDVDITEFCLEGSVTKRLDRVSQAQIRMQMKEFSALYGTMPPGAGSYLKVYFDNATLGGPTLWHHGRVLLCETTADQDTGYVVFNSSDPLELWAWRPVRDDTGDFSKPTIIDDFGTPGGGGAVGVIEDMIFNTEDTSFGGGGPPPADAEGPCRLARGSVNYSTVDVTGAPVDWPMTMAELASLMISTGTVDIVIRPIEFDALENYGEYNLYPGNYGTDLSASVKFQYGMGAYNIQSLRWNEDMTNTVNKLWYYLGPRVLTEADPAGDQHWRANIQGFDPGLTYPPGGQSVDASNLPVGPPWTDNQLGQRIYMSRILYDVRMNIHVWDAEGDAAPSNQKELWRRLWQDESWIRANPQDLVHITPSRDSEIGSFDIGDLVLVEFNTDVRGGLSAAQRVYEYTVAWDASDSVPAISELQTSLQNEGLL